MRRALIAFVGRLTVGRKLALIYLLDLTAVLFVSGILIHEKFIAINFAGKELLGNEYIHAVHQSLLAPGPDTLARLQSVENRLGEQLGSAELNQSLVQALQRTSDVQDAPNFGAAAQAGRNLVTRIGNQSNLILDPDLDSYYTMSLSVLRFPDLLEVLGEIRKLALFPNARDSAAERMTRFLILEGRLDTVMQAIDRDFSEAFAASQPLLRQRLQQYEKHLLQQLASYRDLAKQITASAVGSPQKADLDRHYQASLAALSNTWTACDREMERLLQARIEHEFQRMWSHLGTAAVLLFVILCMVAFVARQIALPLKRLASVADQVSRTGDYSLRENWQSQDEIGRLVRGFNGMLARLDEQRVAQQELVARARAADAQRALVDAVPIPIVLTEVPQHRVLHANQAAQRWLGARESDPWIDGMDKEARGRFFQRLADLGRVDEFEVNWKGGPDPAWALVSARQLEYQGKQAVLSSFTPIGEIKALEQRLELSARVLEATSEGVVIFDGRGRVTAVNPAFCRSVDAKPRDLIGVRAASLVTEGTLALDEIARLARSMGSWQGEIVIRGKDLSYPAWLVVNVVRDKSGEVTHFIAISLDISERKANEKRIHFMAHHDALTGLPNRLLCEERLILSIQQSRRMKTRVAVLFIDLDRFKNVNDSLGHHAGDQLLKSVAGRLKDGVREGDTVARLGGDEFVVILQGLTGAEDAARMVEQRLLPGIVSAHDVEGSQLYVTGSVGISMFPDDGDDPNDLMRNADSAMYQAKRQGRNNVKFFTPALNDQVMHQMHLESSLREALELNQFVLHYQPRVRTGDLGLCGVECLVRWNQPGQGLLAPEKFIPLAEETGFIVGMGRWIIREACRQHVAWRHLGLGSIPMSINLSGVQLRDSGLLQVLRDAVADFGIDAACIELELTESILMDDVETTIRTLLALKEIGLSLSVDDFGTGYSSLSYLYRFPIDKLKIDKTFVRNLQLEPHGLSVTRAIAVLGHSLGLKVVAEGVEDAAAARILGELGCDELQGYHILRPAPAAEIEPWLAQRRQEEAAQLTAGVLDRVTQC
jgi:diguanylate cyclase (GGDEF)-like protein/PAS domain S-box-containing protein